MEQDRQDEPSHIEHVPTSPERAQESGEAAQVSASAEHAVYEAAKLDERGPIVEPDEALRLTVEELKQQLAEIQTKKERERIQHREYHRRYRERNRDKVRERNAAWMRAKRARERGQEGQGHVE